MKGLWELEISPNPELIDSRAQFFIWTLPAINEAKFIRMVNIKLRANNRRLEKRIEDLEIQLNQFGDELQPKK